MYIYPSKLDENDIIKPSFEVNMIYGMIFPKTQYILYKMFTAKLLFTAWILVVSANFSDSFGGGGFVQ